MTRTDEIRAELGADQINELMEVYYNEGFSLKELRELYDLPNNFSDENIVDLFPYLKLSDHCPLCGEQYIVKHVSRGIEGATINSSYLSV